MEVSLTPGEVLSAVGLIFGSAYFIARWVQRSRAGEKRDEGFDNELQEVKRRLRNLEAEVEPNARRLKRITDRLDRIEDRQWDYLPGLVEGMLEDGGAVRFGDEPERERESRHDD